MFEALLRCDIAKAQVALNDLEKVIAANPDVSSEIHAWRLCARICVDSIMGSVAQVALDELREVSRANQSPANLLLCKGVMSSGYLQIGDLAAAKESACEAAAVLQQCSVVWAAFGVLGAGGATQTLIALWERAARERWNDQVPIKELAQQAMRRYFRLSRRSPVCRPWALLLRGRTACLAGDRNGRTTALKSSYASRPTAGHAVRGGACLPRDRRLEPQRGPVAEGLPYPSPKHIRDARDEQRPHARPKRLSRLGPEGLMTNPQFDKIAIVGGGIAGLAAALELTKPGLWPGKNVVVYQMGWRLGGSAQAAAMMMDALRARTAHLVWVLRECFPSAPGGLRGASAIAGRRKGNLAVGS